MSKRYQAAVKDRQVIEQEMLSDARRRDGEYDPDQLAKVRAQQGSEVFDNITDAKCIGIESMLVELLIYTGDPIWGLEPTPIPELDAETEAEAVRSVVRAAMDEGHDPTDPEFQETFTAAVDGFKKKIRETIDQIAKKAAEGMELKIADYLAEGGFDEALNEFITDFATHKAAALMGPVPVNKLMPVVAGTEIRYEEKLILETRRISPLHIYPSGLSTKVGQGDLFIREPITNDAARLLKKVPGVKVDRFEKAFIKAGAVQAGENATLDAALAEIRQKMAQDPQGQPDKEHDLVWWWHWMSRKDVAEFHGETAPEDAVKDELVPMYGLMLNGVVIKAEENLDKTGRPNLFVASYRNRPGSFWGIGGSGLCKSQQDQVNVFARALSNNAHMSSMPRQAYDSTMLVNPDQGKVMYPGQKIEVRQQPNETRKALEVLPTPNHTMPLLAGRNQAAGWADEKTGVYPQSTGSPKLTGPAQTLGGYNRMLNEQTKTLKRALYNISLALGGLIHAYWLWEMVYGEDEDIKGDFQVVTRGPVQSFLQAEDADQILGVMEMVGRNPLLQSAMKPDGLAKLLRQLMKMRRIKTDGILKDESELAEEIKAAGEKAQAGAGGEGGGGEVKEPVGRPENESDRIRAQADLTRAQAAADKVAVDRDRVALERARTLAMIQKAQREIAAERQGQTARGLNFGAGRFREIPAMGGAA